MKLEDKVRGMRENLEADFPTSLQGVDKDRIRKVLTCLDLGQNKDLIDCVFSLLDNERDSWYPKSPVDAKISDGASTGQIGCHIGILQRGGTKLDREGRDYWIKPLRDLGGLEAITLVDGVFVDGHVKAKSPNSCYKLETAFATLLKAPEDQLDKMLAEWASESKTRQRIRFQADMAEKSRGSIGNSHAKLIQSSIENYAVRFLPGYELLYKDDSDGDRISDHEKEMLSKAGVELTLGDAMPDALFWNPKTDALWVIEAVTSDGEVDLHKVKQLQALCNRCGKSSIGFTTTYMTWKDAAKRQDKHKNISPNTYVWFESDPSKHFKSMIG